MVINVILNLIGGLGIFLYGMENMSTGMRKIAGPKLKKILSALTNNRFMSIAVGIFITALVQSSSVSTVMTIGFVNASLLTLQQGLEIILGANIGTTITGWLLALKLGIYGLPIVGASAIFYLFAKKDKHKIISLTVMGLGFIFFGLELMSNGLKPLRELPGFIRSFQYFRANNYFGVIKASLVGALFTAAVQSSAATLGITITLAVQGLIDYPTAVALVLGENVGTTVTALLASIGASANAKRAAYAHTLINVVGVLWVTTLFRPYLFVLGKFSDPNKNVAKAIATAHTLFNAFNIILFIPFVGYLAKFLCKVVKDRSDNEVKVTKLNTLMLNVPSVVIQQSKIEILTMGKYIENSIKNLDDIYKDPNTLFEKGEYIKESEKTLDLYEKEISDINFSILQKDLEASQIDETRGNLITCDEFETISDYLERIISTLNKIKDEGLDIPQNANSVLTTLNNMLYDFFLIIENAYDKNQMKLFVDAIDQYEEIKIVYKEAKLEHFSSVHEEFPSVLTTGYNDALNYYRRAADHIYNIIEHFAHI